MDEDRVPGVIHEELLTGHVLLAQHHVQLLPPLLVKFTEAAVGVAVGMGLAILFPGQLQCQVRMALEFFVETRKIRSGLAAFVDAPRRRSKQGLFQSAIIPAFGQRPSDARRLGAFQILINGSVSDRATAGDLPLPQPELVAESQNFFELSHGQPFHGQCGFLHFSVEPHCPRCCPVSFASTRRLTGCGNRSEMIPVKVPINGFK